MSEKLAHPEYFESVRYYLNSPVPGLDIKFSDDPVAEAHGFLMKQGRHDDLKHAEKLIDTQGSGEQFGLPPASFRADTVAVVASMLGARLGSVDMTDEDILEADRIIFLGGKTKWLGLEIETRPLFEDYMADEQPRRVESAAIGKYIFDTTENVYAPSLFGSDESDSLRGDDTAERRNVSLAGKLLKRLMRHGPSEQVKESDLILLMEHYEETGQILLGTSDQFIHSGEGELGSKVFWLLQLHESGQVPLSQTTNHAGNIVVKYYTDGSRKTEMYNYNNHTAKIIFEAPDNVVAFGDRRAEDPIMTVVAGYEQMRRVPYLADWMKDSEAADYPTTAMLDVYPDRYVIKIQN